VSIDVRPGDFNTNDWEIVARTCTRIRELAQEIAGQDDPADTWDPFTERDDLPALIAQVSSVVERIETATKRARAELACVQHAAMLAAIRRRNAEKAA
jgi:hypothetical protein